MFAHPHTLSRKNLTPAVSKAMTYAGVAALTLAAATPGAWASDLPAAQFIEAVTSSVDPSQYQQSVVGASKLLPESVSYAVNATNGNGSAFLSGTSSTMGGLSPSLSVTASSTGPAFYTYASAEIMYWVRLTGAPAATSVAMVFTASGVAHTNSSNGSAGAGLLYVPALGISQEMNAYLPYGPETDSFDIDKPFMMQVGTQYSVDMRVSARGEYGAAYASMDPTFEFVNASDAAIYRLEYSPGLVPEPSAAALLLLGLVGIGLRRRLRPGCSVSIE